jgi:hypothetical protein
VGWGGSVLENDRLLDCIENPVQATGHTALAAEIGFGVIFQDLARPVDPIDDPSHRGAPFGFPGFIGPRPVGHDEKLRRAGLPDRLEDLRCRVGAVENEERDRCLKMYVPYSMANL